MFSRARYSWPGSNYPMILEHPVLYVAHKLTDSICLPFNSFPSSIKKHEHLGGNIPRMFLPHCNFLVNLPSVLKDLSSPLNRTTIGVAYSLARREIISSPDRA